MATTPKKESNLVRWDGSPVETTGLWRTLNTATAAPTILGFIAAGAELVNRSKSPMEAVVNVAVNTIIGATSLWVASMALERLLSPRDIPTKDLVIDKSGVRQNNLAVAKRIYRNGIISNVSNLALFVGTAAMAITEPAALPYAGYAAGRLFWGNRRTLLLDGGPARKGVFNLLPKWSVQVKPPAGDDSAGNAPVRPDAQTQKVPAPVAKAA